MLLAKRGKISLRGGSEGRKSSTSSTGGERVLGVGRRGSPSLPSIVRFAPFNNTTHVCLFLPQCDPKDTTEPACGAQRENRSLSRSLT